MDEKRVEQMKEYLRLKKLEEEDNSDELLEEVYNSVMNGLESENTENLTDTTNDLKNEEE